MGRSTQSRSHYLYLSMLVVLVSAVGLYPFLDAIILGFHSKDLMNPAADRFVAFGNFIRLFTKERLLVPTLVNTVVFTVGSVAFEFLLGLGSALLLNSPRAPLKNFLKALVLLPWAVPIAINSLIWRFMLAPNIGFVNQLLDLLGFHDFLTQNWLGDLKLVMAVCIFINVWRSFPFYTITLLAGLATVPRELYEAAHVDGASRFARFRHITLPGIRNVALVIVVLHLIWTFTNFDVIYLLTAGGPLHATEVLPTLLYSYAFEHFEMGYAAAIGVFLLIILAVTVGPSYARVNRLQ